MGTRLNTISSIISRNLWKVSKLFPMKITVYSVSKFFLIIRYIDDMFMTTNQPIEEINVELHKAQNKDMNINVESTINTSVHF